MLAFDSTLAREDNAAVTLQKPVHRHLHFRRAAGLWVPALCLFLASGCSGTDGDSLPTDGGVSSDGTLPTGPTGEWWTLITGDWTLPAGTEDYACVRLTVNEDLYITDFRALSPLGTHHSVLTVGPPGQPDGTTACNGGTNHGAMLYGSGIGTEGIALPDGVAMPVRAGQQLLLNLHLYNVSDGPITGTTAIEVRTALAASVAHEAEAILMGKVASLFVPPGDVTQVGNCEMNGDVTLFMVSPHMHRLGTHMRVVAHRDGQPAEVLHDRPYSFEEQLIYPIEPIEMKRGDRIEVECSYNNTTGAPVGFGDSSDQEMCFATTFRYPATGGTFGIVCAAD